MQLTKEEKQLLEHLSLNAYGSKHRWRKILENGIFVFDKETSVAMKLTKRAATKKVYPTLDQIKSSMVGIIAGKEERLKRIKEQQEKQNVGEQTTANTNPDTSGDNKLDTGFNTEVRGNEISGS